MQMFQQYRFQEKSSLAFLILACLVDGSKRATTLHEAVIEADGFPIEPGAFSRVVARMERQGWIVDCFEGGEELRRYQITDLGMQALRACEQSNHEHYERSPDGQRGKERMMPLVFWILRLYPLRWRERYEAEMMALLTQHSITLWTILDLLMGALDARLDPYYRRTHQLLPLRRFKSSWRLLVVSFVAFWFALLPWFWMSQIGIDDANCSNWANPALCMLRKMLGAPPYSAWGMLVTLIQIFLPILLMLFMTMLVVGRGKQARTHLGLAQVVTAGMFVLCFVCGVWLAVMWQLLPQIGRFYPQTPAGLIIGIAGMGLAAVLAQGSLARAASALREMEKAAPRQEASVVDTAPVREEPATSFAVANGKRTGSKGRWILLVGLALLFIVPWPVLISGDLPDHPTLLFSWSLAVVVGLIAAWLVKEPGKKREQRASRRPLRATSPLWWAALLPIPSLLFFMFGVGSGSTWAFLLLAGLMSGATALIVKIRMRHPRIKSLVNLVILALASAFTVKAMSLVSIPFHPWITMLLVSLVSIVPAFFVRVPASKRQARGESSDQDLGSGATPRVVGWVLFLLAWNTAYAQVSLAFYVNQGQYPLPPWTGWKEVFMSVVMTICLIPALVVKIQTSNRQAAGVRKPAQNGLSPKVWILALPVVFLTFVTQLASIIRPDFGSFANVFISWLLTGVAALIMLLAFNLGSQKRRTMPDQEPPQGYMQVQD